MFKLRYTVFALIASTPLLADIHLDNKSDHPVRVSFHGDVCRLFAADRYEYVPCEEKEIPINGTTRFAGMKPDSLALTQKESAIAPRIIFSAIGFSYACRISTGGEQKHYFLTLGGIALSVEKDYFLTIGKGYGYFPRPYVECDLKENQDGEDLPCFSSH